MSTYWWVRLWPGPSVRAAARAESLATPYTNEPAAVVVSDTMGGPNAELAVAVAPAPDAPTSATTVSDGSKPVVACVAVTVAFTNGAGASALQISDEPNCALDRLTRVQ